MIGIANTTALSSFLANNAISKATKPPVFAAFDITIGREPFEVLNTGACPALNEGASPLQRDALVVTSTVITLLLQASISQTAAPTVNQSQLSHLCETCDLSSGNASASVQFCSLTCTDNRSQYAEYLLHMYEVVTTFGVPNSKGAMLPLPSNLQFEEWQKIAHTKEDDTPLAISNLGFQWAMKAQCPPLRMSITPQLTNTVVMLLSI